MRAPVELLGEMGRRIALKASVSAATSRSAWIDCQRHLPSDWYH